MPRAMAARSDGDLLLDHGGHKGGGAGIQLGLLCRQDLAKKGDGLKKKYAHDATIIIAPNYFRNVSASAGMMEGLLG